MRTFDMTGKGGYNRKSGHNMDVCAVIKTFCLCHEFLGSKVALQPTYIVNRKFHFPLNQDTYEKEFWRFRV
jgi:hypothetical protein